MSGYTRQQSYIDGDVILAEHTNDEFDALAEAFSTTLGHKHDGTTAEGPTIDLLLDTDADTGIEVERTADVDKIFFKALGTDKFEIAATRLDLYDNIYQANNKVYGALNVASSGFGLMYIDASDNAVFGNASLPLTFQGVNTLPTYNGFTIWTSQNDGAGSGLDADLLDGVSGENFVRSDVADTVVGLLTFNSRPAFNGGLSGSTSPFTVDSTTVVTNLNSDLLDGLDSSQFLRSDVSDTYTGGTLTVTLPTSTTIEGSLGAVNTLQVFQSEITSDAFISFHVSGDHALHFGLDASRNDLVVGGWSKGANSYLIWHENNDGAGSGLDADLLDGVQGSDYGRLSTANTFTQTNTFSGTINANTFVLTGSTISRNIDTANITLYGGTSGSGANIELYGGTHATNPSLVTFDATEHRFRNQSGSIERIRITSSGNVGIGTTSPERAIHIAANEPAIVLEELDQGTNLKKWRMLSAASNFSIDALDDAFTTGSTAYQISRTANTASQHRFFTNNLERVRVDANGAFFVGTTDTGLATAATGSGLFYNNSSGFLALARDNDSNVPLHINKTSYVSGTTSHIQFRENGVVRGSITSNGSTTAYNTTSDYRLKENVVTLSNSIERLKQLPVHRFNFIGREETLDGFLAHEVQAVVPEAVVGDKDVVDPIEGPQYQVMDASKLVPLLTAALKESIDRIEALEEKIAGYEKDLITYDKRLVALENK